MILFQVYVIIIVLDYWFIVLVGLIFHVMCIRLDVFACNNYYNYELSKLNNIKCSIDTCLYIMP